MVTDIMPELRNRLFRARWFQSFAASTPLLRGVARRRATALFDVTAGFVYSQILSACVALGLFERLARGPQALATLAQDAELPVEALERLVKAAASLGLLERRGSTRVGLGGQGAALLANPSVFDMVRHHALLYQDLADPVALLRAPKGTGRLARYWGYAAAEQSEALSDQEVAPYSALMESTQAFIAREVTAAHPFRRYQHILDVGGGTGAFLSALAPFAPDAKLTVFDLPPVALRAEHRFGQAGLAPRTAAVGGDFTQQSLPEGQDLITFVRVLHDHDDDVVMTLLKKARAALAPGGRVLIAEPMAGTRGAEAMGDAYFGLYLWAMGTGEPRSVKRLQAMLKAAGFKRPRLLKTRQPMLAQVLITNL